MDKEFFYGLEGSNLFKIYVTDMALHGARVASNMYDAQSSRVVTAQFGLLGWAISAYMGKRAERKRAEEEAKYDALEIGGPPFREAHKANFTLSSADISGASVSLKPEGVKGWLSGGNRVQLTVAGGKKRNFLLIGDQNPQYVEKLLRKVVKSDSAWQSPPISAP